MAIEVQIMGRTPTNKESDTQLLENQHFVIVHENWAGPVGQKSGRWVQDILNCGGAGASPVWAKSKIMAKGW